MRHDVFQQKAQTCESQTDLADSFVFFPSQDPVSQQESD